MWSHRSPINVCLSPCLSFPLPLVRHKASGCLVSPGGPLQSCLRGEHPRGWNTSARCSPSQGWPRTRPGWMRYCYCHTRRVIFSVQPWLSPPWSTLSFRRGWCSSRWRASRPRVGTGAGRTRLRRSWTRSCSPRTPSWPPSGWRSPSRCSRSTWGARRMTPRQLSRQQSESHSRYADHRSEI